MANQTTFSISIKTDINDPFDDLKGIELEEFLSKLYDNALYELTSDWLYDNIGSDSLELIEVSSDSITIITSHVPKELLVKLFEFVNDKEALLEVDYREESYQRVGSVVIGQVDDEIRYAEMGTDRINIADYDLDDMNSVDDLEIDVLNYTTRFKDELRMMIEDGDCDIIEK